MSRSILTRCWVGKAAEPWRYLSRKAARSGLAKSLSEGRVATNPPAMSWSRRAISAMYLVSWSLAVLAKTSST